MTLEDTIAKLDRRDSDLRLAEAANSLRETYGHWNEHPEFPLTQWQGATSDGETRLGYWEWIANSQSPAEMEA